MKELPIFLVILLFVVFLETQLIILSLREAILQTRDSANLQVHKFIEGDMHAGKILLAGILLWLWTPVFILASMIHFGFSWEVFTAILAKYAFYGAIIIIIVIIRNFLSYRYRTTLDQKLILSKNWFAKALSFKDW